jgi:HlyD family secretion protein
VGEQVKSSEGDQGRAGRVWVLSPEGKSTPVSIVLGITDGTFSEVMSGDLREGGQVIVEETSGKKTQSQAGTSPLMRGIGR